MASSRKELNPLSAQTADRLNNLLPVDLTPEDVADNPEFVKLLTALGNHITEDGISTQIQRDLTQAEEFMRHEKHTWLLQHVLHKELKELLTDYQLQGLDTALSTENKRFRDILQQCLIHSETKDYLHFSPDAGSNVTLLGITPEDIDKHNTYRKHLQSVQQRLVPEIEDRLRQRCENLLKFHNPSSVSDNGELISGDATQLLSLVEKTQLQLQESKQRLKAEQQKREKQFWLYYKTLLDSMMVLEKLVRHFRLKWQSKADAITAEWLMAKCDATCLKIRLLELQVLCDTYTAETVAAHQKIRKHVDSALKDKQSEYSRLRQILGAYEAVGMGFDSLVEEYGRLKKEVENKKWALQELDVAQNAPEST